MAGKGIEGNCFTFLWSLENISYCLQKKGEPIVSPPFVVDEIDKMKWGLSVYPRGVSDGKYVGFFLQCVVDNMVAAQVKIKYELSFIGKDGSVLKSKIINNRLFSKNENDGYGFSTFVGREDVFISKRSVFLPMDTLTACCKIWKTVGEMSENVQCSSRTRIGVEKRFFQWNIEKFSTLEPEKKYTYQIKSTENDSPLISIDLSLTGGLSSEETVHFDLTLQDTNIKFSSLKLCLIDVSGNKVGCNHEEYWFGSLVKCKEFTLGFTKKTLLAKKSLYLPGDILSLYWEWAFSKGVVLEETEEVRFGSAGSDSKIINIKQRKNEEKMSITHTLNENLKSFYNKQFLCDVKLKTTTNVFPAHKIILSASSLVFSAMFSNNMKEKDGDCVNIEDLSDETISRMLLYIYTSNIEDLTWESASHLYVAADKYDILSLKNICSSYLKDNLSSNNACEVLMLADFHNDGDLKEAVQNYILKHDKAIVNSDEWKLLMETNGKLAAETMCLRYK